MITCKKDYYYYLEADRVALGRKKTIKSFLFDDIWRFQRLLRRVEYLQNTSASTPELFWKKLLLNRLSLKLGFTIPINCFGAGLSIAHYGTIVVNGKARIGANCRLHVCTNIGTLAGHSGLSPTIGDNCYIGPGAKIFGGVTIGNNVAIAANAVVNKSFHEDNITIGGVPARIISRKGSSQIVQKSLDRNSYYSSKQ